MNRNPNYLQNLKDIIRELEKREFQRKEFRLGIVPDEFKLNYNNKQINACQNQYSVTQSFSMEKDLERRIQQIDSSYRISPETLNSMLVAYDHNNVLVDGKYLEASWIKGLYSGRWWLATRCPNKVLLYSFLSIFFKSDLKPENGSMGKSRIRTIIQLNELEHGENFIKGAYYFPASFESSFEMKENTKTVKDYFFNSPPIGVKVECPVELNREKGFLRRNVTLIRDKQTVKITHLSYLGWPDMKGPSEMEKHKLFIEEAEKINRSRDGENPPMLIHCTAGLGRTGAHIVADDILHSSRLDKNQGYYTPLGEISSKYTSMYGDVIHGIDSIRERRPAMVLSNVQVMYLFSFYDYIYKPKEDQVDKQKLIQAPIQGSSTPYKQNPSGSSADSSIVGSVSITPSGPGIVSSPPSDKGTSRLSTPAPTERNSRGNDSNIQHKPHSPGSPSTGQAPKSITTSKKSTGDISKASLVKSRPSTPVTSSTPPIQRKRSNSDSSGRMSSPRRTSVSGANYSSHPKNKRRVTTSSSATQVLKQQQPQPLIPANKATSKSSISHPQRATPSRSTTSTLARKVQESNVVKSNT